MASENTHKREYKQFKIIRKSRLEFLSARDPFAPAALITSGHFSKIKETKVIKVVKFRGSTAHMARADKRRRIVEQMGVDFIRDAKDKTY
jgi:hypothetical protein